MGGDSLIRVLDEIFQQHATTKSNFSRLYADEIAEAACRGLITTRESFTPFAPFGRTWRITRRGLAVLKRARKDAETHCSY